METNNDLILKEDFVKDILIILRETFEGSREGEGSVFLDHQVGVLTTLDALSAAEVSQNLNATTIAAHSEHLKFYLDRVCEFIGGRTKTVNWEQSWLIESVEETEWEVLRAGIRKSYENVLQCAASVEKWDQDNIGEIVAIIAHTAYHLSAIRQIMKTVKSGQKT